MLCDSATLVVGLGSRRPFARLAARGSGPFLALSRRRLFASGLLLSRLLLTRCFLARLFLTRRLFASRLFASGRRLDARGRMLLARRFPLVPFGRRYFATRRRLSAIFRLALNRPFFDARRDGLLIARTRAARALARSVVVVGVAAC